MRLVSCIIQLFIIIAPLFSQNSFSIKVDSLLDESYNKFVELQIIESLKLSEKALLLSEETHYEKGMVYSYLSIARALQEVGLRKEALEYIEKIEDGKYFKKDAFLQADTYWLRGRVASSQHRIPSAMSVLQEWVKISISLSGPPPMVYSLLQPAH